MKKIVLGIFTLALIGATVVSCKKEKAKSLDCETASSNLQKAMSDFIGNSTTDNCIKYKKALQDMLNSQCTSAMTAEQKAAYQSQVNELSCNNIP